MNRSPLEGWHADVRAEVDGGFILNPTGPGHITLSAWPADDNQRGMRLASARLGEREVLDNGFDFPFAGTVQLRLLVDCADRGSRQ
jgi:hypothetical protein